MAKKSSKGDESSSNESKKSHIKLSEVDAALKKKADDKKKPEIKDDHHGPSNKKSRKSKKTKHPKPSDDELAEDAKLHMQRYKLLRKIILWCVVLLGLTVVAVMLIGSQQGDSDRGDDALQEVLDVSEEDSDAELIESRQGFAATYNSALLDVQAVVDGDDGQTKATEDELGEYANFSQMSFTPRDDAPREYYAEVEAEGQLTISTNIEPQYLSELREKHNTDDDTAALHAEFTPATRTGEKLQEIDSGTTTIGETEYNVVSYEITSTYGITGTQEDVYVTVQNDVPYVASLRYSRNLPGGQLQELGSVLESVTYTPPIRDTFGLDAGPVELAGGGTALNAAAQASQSLPDDSIKTDGSKLRRSTILNVVARNAIATVRVAHFDCRNMDLLMPDKSVGISIQLICNGGIGSGSIVSEDGYISTNGHVALMGDADLLMPLLGSGPETLRLYGQYLEAAGIVSPGLGRQMVEDFLAGSTYAAQQLQSSIYIIPDEYIRTNEQERSYAIQLSDDPITFDGKNLPLTFDYSDTVISAELIDYDFDPSILKKRRADLTNQTASDVALLKADLSSAVTVELGGIENVGTGDLVTAIGFPGFVDDGLSTTESRTVASATQGKVIEIGFDNKTVSERKLISTDVPIAPGNSGGPSFDSDGNVVGLATYGAVGYNCDDEWACFGESGVMRDVADFKALLDNENITLDVEEYEATQKWNEVIENFSIGYYKTAIERIDEFEEIYGLSYLSGSFRDVANEKVELGESLEPGLPFRAIAIGGAVTLPLIILATFFALYAHRRKGEQVGIAYPVNPFSANVRYQEGAYAANQLIAQPNVNFNPYPQMQQSVIQPIQQQAQQPQQAAQLAPQQPQAPQQPVQPMPQPQQQQPVANPNQNQPPQNTPQQ